MENPSFICFSASSATRYIGNSLAKEKVIIDSSEYCQRRPPAKPPGEWTQGFTVFEANWQNKCQPSALALGAAALLLSPCQMQLGAHRRVNSHNDNALSAMTCITQRIVQVYLPIPWAGGVILGAGLCTSTRTPSGGMHRVRDHLELLPIAELCCLAEGLGSHGVWKRRTTSKRSP